MKRALTLAVLTGVTAAAWIAASAPLAAAAPAPRAPSGNAVIRWNRTIALRR